MNEFGSYIYCMDHARGSLKVDDDAIIIFAVEKSASVPILSLWGCRGCVLMMDDVFVSHVKSFERERVRRRNRKFSDVLI